MKLCALCGHGFSSSGWDCPQCLKTPPRLGDFYAFAPELAYQSEGFSEDFFQRLFELESGHFWFESRNRIILWGLQKYFPQTHSFMEVGCGTGFVISSIARALPDLDLSASEIFVQGLHFAGQRVPGLKLFQMDARLLPFDSEFDGIGAFDVLEHIKEDELVLREMLRAVKPGGGVLLTVPQHPFLWSPLDDHSYHQRRYTRRELEAKLRETGWEVVHVTSFVTILLPLMLLSRIRIRMQNPNFPGDDLSIHPALNRLFSGLSRLEEQLIRRNIRLPVGGSLLAIARRPG